MYVCEKYSVVTFDWWVHGNIFVWWLCNAYTMLNAPFVTLSHRKIQHFLFVSDTVLLCSVFRPHFKWNFSEHVVPCYSIDAWTFSCQSFPVYKPIISCNSYRIQLQAAGKIENILNVKRVPHQSNFMDVFSLLLLFPLSHSLIHSLSIQFFLHTK